MRSIVAIAAGVFVAASLAGAHAEDRQVSKFSPAQSIVGRVLVCSGATAPADCNERSAIDAFTGASSPSEIGCGVQGLQLLAGANVRARDDQYVKIICSRDVARVD